MPFLHPILHTFHRFEQPGFLAAVRVFETNLGLVLCTAVVYSDSMIGCIRSGARTLCALFLGAALAAGAGADSVVDLSGKAHDPFASPARARVFIFVRTDCPITNRYAPEVARLAQQFKADRSFGLTPKSVMSSRKDKRSARRLSRGLADA